MRMITAQERESGFTLIEALVVMVIFGVIGTFVTTAVVESMHTSSRAQSRIVALADLQRGIERVAREMRVADPLALCSGEEDSALGAIVYRDDKRYVHKFYLSADGESLLQDITVFDPATAVTGTPVSSGVFIADVGNSEHPDNPPLFEYADQDGVPTTHYVTAAQITINLAKQALDSEPVLVSTTVEVRNTRYGGSSGLAC